MEQEKRRVGSVEVHIEVHNSREGENPTTLFRIRDGNVPGAPDDQIFGVTSGGGGRIRKCGFPRVHVLFIEELDVGEEVLSGTRDP